jgi:hypothetical protein
MLLAVFLLPSVQRFTFTTKFGGNITTILATKIQIFAELHGISALFF